MSAIRVSAILGLAMAAVAGHAQTLSVQGLNGTSVAWSAAELEKLPQQKIPATDHGAAVTFEGVALKDALAKVDLPLGERYHSTGASYYVVVEARDGYRAVFAWAELDAGFMDKAVYVVTRRDGKPLPEKDGPFELVAPGEKRNGRWVRQVTAVKVKQGN